MIAPTGHLRGDCDASRRTVVVGGWDCRDVDGVRCKRPEVVNNVTELPLPRHLWGRLELVDLRHATRIHELLIRRVRDLCGGRCSGEELH